MKDIDWSKAPEGATHYCPEDAGVVGRFYNVNKSPMWVDFCEGAGWQVSHNRPEGTWLDTLVARPVTPQWNGTGLPPVWVVCEVMSATASGEWLEATIVAHDGDKAVYRLYDGSYGADPEFFEGNPARPLFRPIRTPEQIAAEEREVAVQAMQSILCRLPAGTRLGAETLYDAGYRMTAEDER